MIPPYKMDEVVERAEEGPVCTETDFDLKIVVPTLKRVIKEHGIKYDPANVVPTDDSLVKDAYEAAYEFFLEVGTYCTTSNRRILFKDDEVKEALASLPGQFEVGQGKDKTTMRHRQVEDVTPPFCLFGPMGQACSEENYVQVVMAYMKEPLADGISSPALDTIDGIPIKVRGASEMLGSVAHTMKVKEAARRIGRPGIFTMSVATAPSDAAQIAASNPQWGKTISDGGFIGALAEMKVDFDLLRKMLFFHHYGHFVSALCGPLLGGFAGGPEGTAIVGIAYHLQGLLVHQAHFQASFPMHMMQSCTTTRDALWATNLTSQSISKYTNIVTFAKGKGAAGPCTDMVLLEAAAHGMAAVSGANLYIFGAARNKYKDRFTPREARMAAEVGHAVARSKMKRSEANAILDEIVKRYEGRIKEAPLGKKIQECYDVKKIRPTAEYVQLYDGVKKQLTDLGIHFMY
jgi:methylamine--corrinoid protein Co-methyltransferase